MSPPHAALGDAPAVPGLLGYEEAARRLGLRLPTLRTLVHRGQIPYIRLAPRIVRFAPADLEAWIAAHRVPMRTS